MSQFSTHEAAVRAKFELFEELKIYVSLIKKMGLPETEISTARLADLVSQQSPYIDSFSHLIKGQILRFYLKSLLGSKGNKQKFVSLSKQTKINSIEHLKWVVHDDVYNDYINTFGELQIEKHLIEKQNADIERKWQEHYDKKSWFGKLISEYPELIPLKKFPSFEDYLSDFVTEKFATSDVELLISIVALFKFSYPSDVLNDFSDSYISSLFN